MNEREALKLTLEALKQIDEAMPFPVAKLAIMEAEKALAQPEQEPVIGTKTWFEDGKVVTQHLTAKNIYKEPEQIPPSVHSNTHQPEPPPECQTEAEKTAFAFGWFKAMEAQRKPEQEPVAWPCVIAEADFSENTITLTMQCTDYKVSAGKHWLSNTPPQRTWVWLTDEEERQIKEHCTTVACVLKTVKAKLKEKNT